MTAPAQTPAFKITKGNPTASEVAALTAVFAQLSAEARAKAADHGAERNLWGRPMRTGGQDIFNPSAFRNVRYY